MNDELNINDDQLRLATSRSLPADGSADAPTAAAREAFLALGCAAESAASEFDEASLIRRLATTCLVESPPSNIPRKEKWQWWALIASSAIAAGMLLAIAQIAMERQRGAEPDIGAGEVANNAPPEMPSLITAGKTRWDDPLDDEIALAAITIEQFSGTSHHFDSSLLDMNDRLEALSRELSGETL
jgi:hypothetical protein